MSAFASGSGLRILGAGSMLSLLLFAAPAHGQTAGQNSGSGQEPGARERPSFSAAGVQGTTAPPGYSSGLSREETATVMTGVMDLNHEILSGLLPDEPAENCGREQELLRSQQADPAAFSPNHALGVFYLRHGETLRSIRYLEAASHAEPANGNNSRDLAVALLAAGRNSEAIGLLERVSGSASHDAALLRLLAFAYQVSGDRGKSAEAYERALGAAADDAANEFGCGLGLIAAGAPDAAAKVFASATMRHPAEARLWLGLGLVQDLKRQKAEAVESLLRAVAANPEYLPPYFFLAGLADASPAHAAEIRNRLAQFVVEHPDSAEAHYDYAIALWRQQRTGARAESDGEIESQLKLALAKEPGMARAHFQLGVIRAEQNDFASAERELLETVKQEPNNAEAHYRLAQVYKRNQKPELASAEMRRFVALHGSEEVDDGSAEAVVGELGSDLLQQIRTAGECGGAQRQQP